MSEENDDIDLWLGMDPTEMVKKPEVTDKIIEWMRKQRGGLDKGIKPKKAEGPKKSIDLSALGLSKKAPPEPPAPMKKRSF